MIVRFAFPFELTQQCSVEEIHPNPRKRTGVLEWLMEIQNRTLKDEEDTLDRAIQHAYNYPENVEKGDIQKGRTNDPNQQTPRHVLLWDAVLVYIETWHETSDFGFGKSSTARARRQARGTADQRCPVSFILFFE